jgi:SAM-dependent methyltransferase
MRHVSSLKVHNTFPPHSCLLELGCGTGEDAVVLAKRGSRILALDISYGMIAKAKEKAIAQGLQDHVVFACSANRALRSALAASPWKTFDGAYANFSLAYEESLRLIAATIHEVLKPRAFFICTLPNRIVLSEILLYGLQLRFPKFVKRFEKSLFLDIHGHRVRYHTYSPWDVEQAFEGFFELKELVGIPVFMPPTYLHSFYEKLGPVKDLLKRLDSLMASKYPWNHLGEHTLFTFQRLVS